MSINHPIIAVTGSSGAGTTTVMKSFAHIFRRERISAQTIEGDSFHRYDRKEMRERVRIADSGASPPISHFGPEANLLGELDATFAEYGESGNGKVRRYIHDAIEAKELGGDAGTFTPWQPMAADSDLLFYE
ncbi:MAG: phosphoribulokinase, partial [Gammaproteobacteria bacterium]|nr:phosphoribulokinase [Gammaproteobacteria bacterium]